MTVRDMQLMQTDILDVQARDSVSDMLYCVEKADLTLTDWQADKIKLAKDLL